MIVASSEARSQDLHPFLIGRRRREGRRCRRPRRSSVSLASPRSNERRDLEILTDNRLLSLEIVARAAAVPTVRHGEIRGDPGQRTCISAAKRATSSRQSDGETLVPDTATALLAFLAGSTETGTQADSFVSLTVALGGPDHGRWIRWPPPSGWNLVGADSGRAPRDCRYGAAACAAAS